MIEKMLHDQLTAKKIECATLKNTIYKLEQPKIRAKLIYEGLKNYDKNDAMRKHLLKKIFGDDLND